MTELLQIAPLADSFGSIELKQECRCLTVCSARSLRLRRLPANASLEFHEEAVQPGHALQLSFFLERKRVLSIFFEKFPSTRKGRLGWSESDDLFRCRLPRQQRNDFFGERAV
jgi:hypothetical protein